MERVKQARIWARRRDGRRHIDVCGGPGIRKCWTSESERRKSGPIQRMRGRSSCSIGHSPKAAFHLRADVPDYEFSIEQIEPSGRHTTRDLAAMGVAPANVRRPSSIRAS